MSLSIIVATDLKGGIGYKGDLLFKIKEDMKRFKELTSGHTVIMGRKTYDSLPNGALPNRHNIILTRDDDFSIDYKNCKEIVSIIHDIKILLRMYRYSDKEVFIIGGGEIYKQFLPYCDKIYLTKVYKDCGADTFFSFSEHDWDIEDITEMDGYEFIDLIRKESL